MTLLPVPKVDGMMISSNKVAHDIHDAETIIQGKRELSAELEATRMVARFLRTTKLVRTMATARSRRKNTLSEMK